MLQYRIVHPRGDRSKLCVVQAWDYELDDWDLATEENFYYDDEAAHARCAELADQWGLDIEPSD